MNIYYNIKSPIESDKNVRKIVDAYLKSKENGESLYGSAVSYGEQDSKFNEKEFSIFRRKIENLELKRIRRLDEKDVKKYNLAKKIPMVRAIVEKIVGRGATREFPNYEQYKLVMNHSNEEIFMRYDAIKNGKKKSLSREDKAIVSLLDDYLINEVHTFNGIAAYHVYEDELEGYAEHEGELKYKIYLNIPYDQLYKFADKFMEICRDKKIPYTFKVMSPLKDAPDRSEKMCIYCNKDTFYKSIDIIRAIKSANPELNPSNPPILAGRLDGWIGIGSDPRETSYNVCRSSCIKKALDNYFDGMSVEEARKMLRKNPHLVEEVREAIESVAMEQNIATKFCFTRMGNQSIREQDQEYHGSKFKIDHSKLRIKGLSVENDRVAKTRAYDIRKRRKNDRIFDEYVQTRMRYGKDSQEVYELFNLYAQRFDCTDQAQVYGFSNLCAQHPATRKNNARKNNNRRNIKKNYPENR